MNKNRRETLAMLGLASPAVAVGVESFVTPAKADDLPTSKDWTNKQAANAFRRLADAIDAGQVTVFSLRVGGDLLPRELIKHRLDFEFAYSPGLGSAA